MINPIITLTSDYGSRDYFISTIKASIYEIESVNVVVYLMKLPLHLGNVHILRNAYHHFPKGTIHLIGVDAGKKRKKKISQKLMAIILLDR